MKSFFFISLLLPMLSMAAVWQEPTAEGLQFVLENSYRIDSGSEGAHAHKNWKSYNKITSKVKIFEKTVDEIEKVMCDFTKDNRSVLIVGNPGESYKYIFSRFVSRSELKGIDNPEYECGQRWDFELNLGKMEHAYVGETDKHFQKILETTNGTGVFIYISDLASIIGKGSHSNNKNGIESIFARAVSSGEMQTVAFIDQYRYQELLASEHAFVANAFAQVIHFNEAKEELVPFFNQYIDKRAELEITPAQYNFIMNLGKKHQPSYFEPDRTIKVLDAIMRLEEIPSKIDNEFLRKITLKTFGLPEWLVNKDYSRLKTISAKLKKKVVGADEIIDPLVETIRAGYMIGRADGRPVATSLFVGPTGLGKSFLPKKLAEALEVELFVYDMTQYQNAFTSDKFVDDISNKLIANPYSVFLLEEIDKSSTEVLDKLYFMLDEGIFYGRGQRKISASGSIFLLTTNAGEFTVIDNANGPNLKREVMNELQKRFRPSFLNRFDNISIFKPFNDQNYQALAKVMVDEQIEYIKNNLNFEVKLTEAVYAFLVKNGQSKTFGARPLKRLIERVVMTGLTNYQLMNKNIEEGSSILFDVDGQGLNLKVNNGPKFYYKIDLDINNGGN